MICRVSSCLCSSPGELEVSLDEFSITWCKKQIP